MQIGRKIPLAIDRYLLTAAIVGLWLLLYMPLLVHWYHGWVQKSISLEHEYFSHGVIGLPFAAYLAWQNRTKWRSLPNRNHPLGAVLLVMGGLFYWSGLADLIDLSFPLVLAGICLWLKGVPGIKLQGFPLLLAFLATPNPVPYLIAPYTLILQRFIATMAGFFLVQVGMNVRVEEIYLFVNNQVVEVAPHCAGLKMLFTSLYVSLMLLYWTGAWDSRTKVGLLLGGAVVTSVSANILRNTLLTFFHGTGNEAAFVWLHDGWGGDVYSAGMLGLIVVLLNRINAYLPNPS